MENEIELVASELIAVNLRVSNFVEKLYFDIGWLKSRYAVSDDSKIQSEIIRLERIYDAIKAVGRGD